MYFSKGELPLIQFPVFHLGLHDCCHVCDVEMVKKVQMNPRYLFHLSTFVWLFKLFVHVKEEDSISQSACEKYWRIRGAQSCTCSLMNMCLKCFRYREQK